MLYSKILNSLYNGTTADIIDILNSSIYVTNLNKLNNELIIMHTGFSFNTHKGKAMELYSGFSVNNNEIIIIRQSRNEWTNIPQANGLLMKLTSKNYYLSEIEDGICYKIEEANNDYNLISQVENKNNLYNLTLDYLTENFGLFTIKTEYCTSSFPWFRHFEEKIYLDGIKFHAVKPVDDINNRN